MVPSAQLVHAIHAPWSSSMADTYQSLSGTDTLGVTAVSLLSNSLAPSTYANYDSALRQFFAFRTEEGIPPLHATPASLVRYTAWLGRHGGRKLSTTLLLSGE
jgi:hypothetical protein